MTDAPPSNSAAAARDKDKDDERGPAFALVTGALCLAILALFAWPQTSAQPETVGAGTLFEPATQCTGSGDPATRARSAESQAQAKAERYPFAPAEGPRALKLLSEAQLCRRAADDSTAAARSEAMQTALHTKIEKDYLGYRVRLERAMELGRASDARRELQALVSLFDGQTSPYAVRLRQLQRRYAPAAEAGL